MTCLLPAEYICCPFLHSLSIASQFFLCLHKLLKLLFSENVFLAHLCFPGQFLPVVLSCYSSANLKDSAYMFTSSKLFPQSWKFLSGC